MKKRILSLLLCIALCLTLMPMTVFATGTEEVGGTGKTLPYSFDFETDMVAEGWTNIDADGDGQDWISGTNKYGDEKWGVEGSRCAISQSDDHDLGAFDADNRLFSPAITIPAGGATVSWYERSQDPVFPDFYEVYVSETNTEIDLSKMTMIFDGFAANPWTQRSVELKAAEYAGKTVYIAFRHHCYNKYMLEIDDFAVEAVAPAHTYTVTFDANGGTVTPTSAVTGTDGKLVSLPTPTRSGYSFVGWYTIGDTKVDTNTVFTEAATIYAHWSRSFSFAHLPKTGVATITVPEGDYYTGVAAKDAFLRYWDENIKTDGDFLLIDYFDTDSNGYHSWMITFENGRLISAENGTATTEPDTMLDTINNEPFYASWDKWVNGTFALDSCTVTFDPKGGSAIDDVTFTDATFGELPTPERDGYVFDGWYAQDYQEQDSVDYFYDAAIARAYILRLSNLPKAVGPTPGFKDGNVIDFDVVFTGTVPTNLDVNDYNISSNYYTIKNNEISGSIKFTNSMQDGGPQYGGNCLTFIDIETDYTDEKLDPSVSYAIKYFRVFPSRNQKVTAETAVPSEQNITLYAGWTKNVESAPTPITEVTVLNFESPIPGKTAGQLSNLQIPDGVHYKFDPDFPGNFSRWYDKKSEYGYLQNDVIFTVGKDYQEGAWLVADEGYYFADNCTFKAIGADNVEKELYEVSTFVDEYDITKANIWAVYEKAGTPITEVTVLNFESPIPGKTTGELSNLQIPEGAHYKFDPDFLDGFSRWYDEESEYGYLMDDVTFTEGKDYQEGAWLVADEGYYFADDCTFKAIGADNTEKEIDEMSTFVDEYDITKANIWAAYETAVAPIPVTYTIIVGANGEWTKGSAAGLSFTSDAPFDKFDSVKIDGTVIAAANYTAEAGSTKITLAPAYLETLSVGTHTIEIVSNDGSASTNFTVKAAAQPPVPAKYTVSFNMNGHGTQIADQTVEDGSKATKPADPTASGYTFDGWYAYATFSVKFDFNTAITANTTVYAKWTKNPVTPPTPGEDHGHNVHHYDPDNAIVIGGKSGETAETNPETGAPVMNFGAIAVILGAAFLLSKKH